MASGIFPLVIRSVLWRWLFCYLLIRVVDGLFFLITDAAGVAGSRLPHDTIDNLKEALDKRTQLQPASSS